MRAILILLLAVSSASAQLLLPQNRITGPSSSKVEIDPSTGAITLQSASSQPLNMVSAGVYAGSPIYVPTIASPTLPSGSQSAMSFDGTKVVLAEAGGSYVDIRAAESLRGTTLASNVVSSSLTSAAGGTFGTNAFNSTAFVPQTTTVNGQALSGNITVAAAAGTLTGSTLASGVTTSSLTSVGTITSLTATAIGATTPGTGAFTTLSASGVASFADGTKTNPSIRFSAESGTGFFRNGTTQIGLAMGTNTQFLFFAESFRIAGSGSIGFSSGGPDASTYDTILVRAAANTLAMRNGTNSQLLQVFNTYTDASNYERGNIGWVSNSLTISADNAGTGASRGVLINAGAGANITFAGAGSARVIVGGGGAGIYPATDNSSGPLGNSSFRWTAAYVAGNVVVGAGNASQTVVAPTYIKIAPVAVASLTSASTAGEGALATVNDATSTTTGTTVAGGGSNKVLVRSNGTNWIIN